MDSGDRGDEACLKLLDPDDPLLYLVTCKWIDPVEGHVRDVLLTSVSPLSILLIY